MKKAATLADIAKKLGVSAVTVSNALLNKKGVSEELRSQIIETANELNYKRPQKGEKNSMSSGERIGVITSGRYLDKYTSFYWEMYQKVVVEASQKGSMILLEIVTLEKEEQCIIPAIIKEEKVDALIILGLISEQYVKVITSQTKIPIVFLDFYNYSIPVDSVISNGYFGMYQMTNCLLNAGHTDIAFVGNIKATSSIMDRYLGYSKALLERGIKERKEWVISDRDLRTGMINIILPEEMPTAFVCNCDLIAEKLTCLLEEQGYQVPEDISLVGYDDFLSQGKIKNKITTYAVDMESMAHEAMKLILKRLRNPDETEQKMIKIVDGRKVIRSSVNYHRP